MRYKSFIYIFFSLILLILTFTNCQKKDNHSKFDTNTYNNESITPILMDLYTAEYLIFQLRNLNSYKNINDKELSIMVYSSLMKKYKINDSQLKEILISISYNNKSDILDSVYDDIYKSSFE